MTEEQHYVALPPFLTFGKSGRHHHQDRCWSGGNGRGRAPQTILLSKMPLVSIDKRSQLNRRSCFHRTAFVAAPSGGPATLSSAHRARPFTRNYGASSTNQPSMHENPTIRRNSSQVVMFLQCRSITREIEILCRNFTHFRHNFYELLNPPRSPYPDTARATSEQDNKDLVPRIGITQARSSSMYWSTGLGAFTFFVPDPAKPVDAMETSATSTRGDACASQATESPRA